MTERLNELKVPVQLIWGADDPLFPVAHATRAHSMIDRSKLTVIEGAGHNLPEESPREFADAVWELCIGKTLTRSAPLLVA